MVIRHGEIHTQTATQEGYQKHTDTTDNFAEEMDDGETEQSS